MIKAEALAKWAHALAPAPGDLALAARLLRDTVAVVMAALARPPGSPSRPPSDDDLQRELAVCAPDVADRLRTLDWSSAVALLEREFGHAGVTA